MYAINMFSIIVKVLFLKKENGELKGMTKYIKTTNSNILTGKSKKNVIFRYHC